MNLGGRKPGTSSYRLGLGKKRWMSFSIGALSSGIWTSVKKVIKYRTLVQAFSSKVMFAEYMEKTSDKVYNVTTTLIKQAGVANPQEYEESAKYFLGKSVVTLAKIARSEGIVFRMNPKEIVNLEMMVPARLQTNLYRALVGKPSNTLSASILNNITSMELNNTAFAIVTAHAYHSLNSSVNWEDIAMNDKYLKEQNISFQLASKLVGTDQGIMLVVSALAHLPSTFLGAILNINKKNNNKKIYTSLTADSELLVNILKNQRNTIGSSMLKQIVSDVDVQRVVLFMLILSVVFHKLGVIDVKILLLGNAAFYAFTNYTSWSFLALLAFSLVNNTKQARDLMNMEKSADDTGESSTIDRAALSLLKRARAVIRLLRSSIIKPAP